MTEIPDGGRRIRIDVPYCNRQIAFRIVGIIVWQIIGVRSHHLLSTIVCGLLAFGTAVEAFSWIGKRRNVLRDGPIKEFVSTGGPTLPQTIGIVAGILLTAVTIAFTAMTVAIVAMVVTSAGRFPVGMAALVLVIDAFAWAATVYWWKTLWHDRKQAALLTTITPAIAITVPKIVAQTETLTASTPHHWWTETGTRDEVQQKVGQ